MNNSYKKTTDRYTESWLNAQGINTKQFDKAYTEQDYLLLKALKSVTNILKSYGDLLNEQQALIFNQFRIDMANSTSRAKLKAHHAYQVLNICSAVGRKVFILRKKIIKIRKRNFITK